MRINKRYGWIPDLPDQRDFTFSIGKDIDIPQMVDLRPNMPSVYDQGDLGSCTAQAIGAAHEYSQLKQIDLHIFTPSKMFIYYNERVMEGTVDSDSGAMIRDGIKSIAKQGVCPEIDWPYDIPKFRTEPPQSCYTIALDNQALTYYSVIQTPITLKMCLASGFPIIFGFSVYESFETEEVKSTGVVPMPQPNETLLGGHAVLIVGYDDSESRFIVRNSWGEDWGQDGYFTMPYDYVTNPNLSDDFWTIKLVE